MTEINLPYSDQSENENAPSNLPWHRRLSASLPALIASLILLIVVIWGLLHLLVLVQPLFSSPITSPKTTNNKPMKAPAAVYPKQQDFKKPAPKPVVKNVRTQTPTASPADLSLIILEIGIIDPATGAFVNRPPVSPADMAAVRFDIANNGGSATGAWYFNAQLPTRPAGHAYHSPVQEPLGPGDHIVNILRFSPVVSGGGAFNVIIDSEGMVGESNETNNTATVFIPMPTYY